jgi:hypothetical protein
LKQGGDDRFAQAGPFGPPYNWRLPLQSSFDLKELVDGAADLEGFFRFCGIPGIEEFSSNMCPAVGKS